MYLRRLILIICRAVFVPRLSVLYGGDQLEPTVVSFYNALTKIPDVQGLCNVDASRI